MDKFDWYLDRGYERGRKNHPEAPKEHHCCYANSVAYAMTGRSGGYGGPSMREHLASRIISKKFGGTRQCTLEQALEALDECCYGPLTVEHATMLRDEECFDDAPGEIEAAEKLLLN